MNTVLRVMQLAALHKPGLQRYQEGPRHYKAKAGSDVGGRRTGNKLSSTPAPRIFRDGSTGTTPSSGDLCGFSGSIPLSTHPKCHFRPGSDNQRFTVQEKPPPTGIEFSVTSVFRVRIVDPLDAATAEKWQGIPHLAFASGVGRVQ